MHVTEQKWDKVKSNRTLRSSVAHATATDKLAKVARSMGVDEVMRWKAASVSYPSFLAQSNHVRRSVCAGFTNILFSFFVQLYENSQRTQKWERTQCWHIQWRPLLEQCTTTRDQRQQENLSPSISTPTKYWTGETEDIGNNFISGAGTKEEVKSTIIQQ